MKLFYSLILLVLFSNCSPENMLNKKLDGKWSLISINGENLKNTYSKEITFSKSGKGGDVVYSTIRDGKTEIKKGIYALIKTNSISIAFPNSSFGSGYETEVYDFTTYSKTDLTLTQEGDGNNVFIFEKE